MYDGVMWLMIHTAPPHIRRISIGHRDQAHIVRAGQLGCGLRYVDTE